MSTLKKTVTSECLVSKEVVEASDRLFREIDQAAGSDPVLAAKMKAAEVEARANIGRARARKSAGHSHADLPQRPRCAGSVIVAANKKPSIKL